MRPSLTWNDFYSLQRFGMTPDLENIQRFCELLGHPENSFPSIHIGGTNGKGSVTAMLSSILHCSGLKVGMYTSPHLRRFEERIQVSGEQISEERTFAFLEAHWTFIQKHHCTFFETATALALDYFSEQAVQVAVVEVGLGGTHDATRVVHSILAILTSIDFDHTERLGNTLEQIARDKAGIFRPGYPALIGTQQSATLSVLEDEAASREASLFQTNGCVTTTSLNLLPHRLSGSFTVHLDNITYFFADLCCPLTGSYQVENLKLALVAALWLHKTFPGITPNSIREGLGQVHWPGRLQIISERPTLLVDVAHNPSALLTTLLNVQAIWKPARILTIFSALRDKDLPSMMDHLKRYAAHTYLVPLTGQRGYTLAEITAKAQHSGLPAEPRATVPQALRAAFNRAKSDDVILATGSHYLVQEVLKSEDLS